MQHYRPEKQKKDKILKGENQRIKKRMVNGSEKAWKRGKRRCIFAPANKASTLTG